MSEIVGLDIGTTVVRATGVDTRNGVSTFKRFSQVSLPAGAIVDGEIQDPAAVSEALKQLWVAGKFSTKSVQVGVAGLRVFAREIDIRYVPDDEVDGVIRLQTGDDKIPNIADSILSTRVTGDETIGGEQIRHVLVAAVHKDIINKVIEAVEGAGLKLVGIDLVPSALVRALATHGEGSVGPEAIVDIGGGLTSIVVHDHGQMQFVRPLDVGGVSVSTAISKSLGVSLADAELLKYRLDGSTQELRTAAQAAAQVTGDLIDSIKTSLDYFARQPGRLPVKRILLTGGGSLMGGLAAQLQSATQVEVISPAPLVNLHVDPADAAQVSAATCVLASSVGLALPEPDSSVKQFDLIPATVRAKQFDGKVLRATLVGVAVVVLIVAGLGAMKFLAVQSAQDSLAPVSAQVSQLQTEARNYNGGAKIATSLIGSKVKVSSVSKKSVNWAAVLSELNRVMPPGLTVTVLNGSAPSYGTAPAASATSATPLPAGDIGYVQVTVTGSFDSSAHFQPVAAWITDIPTSPMFGQPTVSSITNTQNGTVTVVTFQSTVPLTSAASLAGGKG